MRLTGRGKALVAITVIGFLSAALWHLGLKDMVADRSAQEASAPAEQSATESGAPATRNSTSDSSRNSRQASAGGALGTPGNPLKYSGVSFHGYAPMPVAAGGSLTTQRGSIFDRLGVNVEFVIQDDIPTLSTIFESGAAHCAWRTSDFWAQEHPNLRNAGLDAKAIMVVDNTQGADAIIARDPAIRSVEDLAGRTVGLLQFTPSHGMSIDAIENSALTARAKASVKYVFINPDEGTAGVRAALEAGAIDAAALWDPDLSLALKQVPGARVIYSTKTATNLIYDVVVCDQRVLDDPANHRAIEAFVAGWMEGVERAEKDQAAAIDGLVNNMEFFKLLADEEGRPFIGSLFDNLVWTGLEDNARILGFAGGTNHYERVYRRFDQIYRGIGALANPNSPVIAPQESFDYRFIKKLIDADQVAQQQAKQPEFTFSASERETASKEPAVLTKPVSVGFKTGSADLTKRAQRTIDTEMVPFIESNGSAYFIVSGNTDSTGGRAINLQLSERRAHSVVKYLRQEWEFPPSRFVIEGAGPDKPLCNERNPQAENLTLEECRALNRTTRVAVLAR